MSARWPRMTLAAALPVLMTCATAQTSSSRGSSSSDTFDNSRNYERPDSVLGGHDPNLSHRQFVARRQAVHNRMVDNVTKLLELTHELQESVRLHEPTSADARSLDDIAKLARAVRDGMRQ